jgi:diacylglycerol kinase family enzyme
VSGVGTSLESLERVGEQYELSATTPSKRVLVIVNPFATTVSDRLRQLVVYALRGRYDVHAIETEGRHHATELCRAARTEGYDAVIAFGGDGTLNEAANGLVGTDIPLGCLPGGATNVYCRTIGMPDDIVDATEHMLRLADEWNPRSVDVGKVNGRHYLFAAGMGLDASVVERVDRHPRLKTKYGTYYYAYAALATFGTRYVSNPPRLRVEVGDETLEGVTVATQIDEPYTLFRGKPMNLTVGAGLQSGTFSGAVLDRANPLDAPPIAWRAIAGKPLNGNRHVHPFTDVTRLRAESLDERAIPLQVDGDHIADVNEAEFEIVPSGLRVIA